MLTLLAKAKAGRDPVLGLAASLTLLMLTSDDAHPSYISSIAAAVLIEQLLQARAAVWRRRSFTR